MPNPENASRAELETAAKVAPTQRASDRYRAMIALIMGIEHETVAKLFGVTRRVLSVWVRRFNESGIDGLIDKKSPGRPRRIAGKHAEKCLDLLEHPEKAGEVHWTAVKLHGTLRDELQLEVGYRTVVRFLHDNNYRLRVPQPWPDRQDEEARKAFVERLETWLQDEKIELWFCDEMGVEGDPRPRRRWVKKGEKARVTRNGDHIRMNVTGMVCPRTGEFFALEFSHSDGVVLQTFLDYANQDVKCERPRNFLILDNASWHKRKSIQWGQFEPVFLPPYSPDLNPIERLWLLIKAEWFTDFIAKTRDQLIQRLDQALCWVINRHTRNKNTCRIRKNI